MASTPSWPNLAKGNTGTNIKALQCLLNYRNKNTALAVDSSFGPAVYNAVVAFQKSKGITANGIAGKDTLSRLVAVVQNGNRNEAVRGAQHLLSKFESFDIDGSFGPGCLTAVKNFQKKMEFLLMALLGLLPGSTCSVTTSILAGAAPEALGILSRCLLAGDVVGTSVIRKLLMPSRVKKAVPSQLLWT